MSEHLFLVVDCLKLTMPQWIEAASISDAEVITVNELCRTTNYHLSDVEELSPEDKSIAHRRFTMISGILPFIGDKDKRSTEINRVSELSSISKQSIRNYLCLYLAYQTITVLAPRHAVSERPLTSMEKAMRWGLNKFFYTKNKNSLKIAYTMLIKAKFTDENGKLLPDYPSFYQFRYFYRKTRKMQRVDVLLSDISVEV